MTMGNILNNLHLKILALFLAVIIWFFVMAERETEIETSATIEINNLAKDLVIEGSAPKRLELRLAGPRLLMKKPGIRNLRISLDMRDIREGTVLFTGFERRLHLPPGIRLTRVYPATIECSLVRKDMSNLFNGVGR